MPERTFTAFAQSDSLNLPQTYPRVPFDNQQRSSHYAHNNTRTSPCGTNREFKELTQDQPEPAPADRPFKPKRLKAAAYGRGWESKRGSAVRLAVVLLREDHQAMERRVCTDDQTTKTYAEVSNWLGREAEYLRKTARMMDTAGTLLAAIIERCKARSPQIAGELLA